MSNKAKPTTSKPGGKLALAPKLRFPEFRDAAGWEQRKLGDAATFFNGRAYRQEELLEKGKYKVLRVGNFFTNNSWYYSNLELEGTKYCEKGDLLYAWSASFGPRLWLGEKTIYHYHIWKVEEYEGIDKFFLFITLEHQTEKMKAQSANGLGLLHITKGTIEGWRACFPKKDEQQKVAECLSSVDELMAVQARKLNALKTHKKGLMQQLFPREGETQPRLRFPEFQKSGEWVEKKLGEFADVAASGDLDSEHFSPIKAESFCYPVFSNAVENEGLYGYYSVPKYPAGCVTITARGTLGVAFLRQTKFMGIGRLLVLKFNQGVDSRFMKDCWNHLAKIPQEVTSIPQLTAVTARVTIFPIPSLEEQQRIADCLTSLDDFITAQTQVLDALKSHKQGLMQQLFPSPDEVEA